MIKNLIRWIVRVDKEVVPLSQPPIEEPPKDVIEPPEWWKRCLSGTDCEPSVVITRQYVNYYREKEGLPIILKDRGVLTIYTIMWLYDMIKKYETLE